MKTAIATTNLTKLQRSQIQNIVDTTTNAKVCFATNVSVVVISSNLMTTNMLEKLVAKHKSLKVGKIERFFDVKNKRFVFGFEVSSNK